MKRRNAIRLAAASVLALVLLSGWWLALRPARQRLRWYTSPPLPGGTWRVRLRVPEGWESSTPGRWIGGGGSSEAVLFFFSPREMPWMPGALRGVARLDRDDRPFVVLNVLDTRTPPASLAPAGPDVRRTAGGPPTDARRNYVVWQGYRGPGGPIVVAMSYRTRSAADLETTWRAIRGSLQVAKE